jgi:gamma-glutamylcyclotransferase
MLYFAYGSNMDWQQMRDRCPSARFVGAASLHDHSLAFTRRSVKRRCGVADVVPVEGQVVWGAVFEVDDRDIGRLDAAEGYSPGRAKNSYRREERHVFLDGDGKQPLAAGVYFGEFEKAPPLPSQDYKNLILDGARRWGLPEAYIRQLEAIEVAG